MLVFKVGGSLLHQPDCVPRLRKWIEEQDQTPMLGVVGGGEVIEGLRLLNQQHPLDQVAMHWRCIDALKATWSVACELFPEGMPIATKEELIHYVAGGKLACNQPVFEESYQTSHATHPGLSQYGRPFGLVLPAAFYSEEGTQVPLVEMVTGAPLSVAWPACSWETTSDSLALLLAIQLRANRCVLLKSCVAADVASLTDAVTKGVVDPGVGQYANRGVNIDIQQLPS